MLKTISIFCASRWDAKKQFRPVYEQSLHYLVEENIKIAYGGANDGYMGLLADSVLEANGYLIGCMPRYFYDLGRHEQRCQQFYLVDSIPERLQVLEALSQGFLAFPGGLGTLEEVMSMLSYNAIQLIQKPVGLLNVGGYFNPLLELIENGKRQGYIQPIIDDFLIVSEDITEIITRMRQYTQNLLEYTDGYDQDGQRIITGIYREQKDLQYHYKSVFLLLIDSENRLLIQKRAYNKTFPGLWDFSATGGVRALEEGYQGMRREALEELGIWLPLSDPTITIPDKHHLMEIYVHRLQGPIDIYYDESEILDIRWVTKQECLQLFEQREFIHHDWRKQVLLQLWPSN